MKKQIMFVDDEPLVLDSLRRALRRQRNEWEMIFLGCPEKAWDQLLTNRFDAVVADVKMPGTNGLQLLQRIQQTEATRDVRPGRRIAGRWAMGKAGRRTAR